jgi:DNA-binding response OmpR family regulator
VKGSVLRQSTILKGVPILVVEDDLIQALDLAESLREGGASVVGPVCDPNEAVRLARENGCRAAVLDFQLGSRNTAQIALELQRQQTPFVIHTGYHCAELLPFHWPGCRVVAKPADIPRLVRTVAALVRWKSIFLKPPRPLAEVARGISAAVGMGI